MMDEERRKRLDRSADDYEAEIALMRESNNLMRKGVFRLFDLSKGERVDVSDEAIERTERQIAILEQIVAEYRKMVAEA